MSGDFVLAINRLLGLPPLLVLVVLLSLQVMFLLPSSVYKAKTQWTLKNWLIAGLQPLLGY